MNRENVKKIIKRNLRALVKAKGITQTQLAEILDVAGKSTVSNYLNDAVDSVPDVASLYNMMEYYGIPFDVFLSPYFDPSNSYEIEGTHNKEYDKFIGVYNLYYLTTNKISTVSNRYNNESELAFGVLAIVKNAERCLTKDSYRALACFSFRSRAEADTFKQEVLQAYEQNDYVSVRNVFAGRCRYAEGGLEMVQKGRVYALTLTGYSTAPEEDRCAVSDKILMMGFNPDNSSPVPYIGGKILATSLSRGMKKSPCSQVIMISRETVEDDCTDITNQLLRTYEQYYTNSIADSILSRMEALYKNEYYSSEDRDILLRSHINKCFAEELTNATSQLFYILEEEDQYFYHYLKNFAKQ